MNYDQSDKDEKLLESLVGWPWWLPTSEKNPEAEGYEQDHKSEITTTWIKKSNGHTYARVENRWYMSILPG